MVIVGDTFRNFVDGVIIAGAFAVSIPLGVVTALALITHEIPQQIGDFLVVLRSGYSRRSALGFSLLSGAVMMLGGVLGYYALRSAPAGVPLLLSIAAGSMLYVSVADLIPGLVRRHELSATATAGAADRCGGRHDRGWPGSPGSLGYRRLQRCVLRGCATWPSRA